MSNLCTHRNAGTHDVASLFHRISGTNLACSLFDDHDSAGYSDASEKFFFLELPFFTPLQFKKANDSLKYPGTIAT
jgi:hypothetical protein